MTSIPHQTITELLSDGNTRQRQIINIEPGKAKLMHLGYSNVLCDDSRIEAIEKQIENVVQYQQRDRPSAHLENYTGTAQDVIDADDTKGGSTMASHRIRCCVGLSLFKSFCK